MIDRLKWLWQGNRVKGSAAGIDEACEEIVVPGGDLAPNAQRVFAGRFADQVVSHMLDGCEVGGGMLGADAAFVIPEGLLSGSGVMGSGLR